jgi:hypothetical protein
MGFFVSLCLGKKTNLQIHFLNWAKSCIFLLTFDCPWVSETSQPLYVSSLRQKASDSTIQLAINLRACDKDRSIQNGKSFKLYIYIYIQIVII